MEAERQAARSARPRPLLLALLGIAVVAFLLLRTDMPIVQVRPAPAPAPAAGAEATIDPAALDVHLDTLTQERPKPASTARNPFRFETRPAAAPESFAAPVPDLGMPGNATPPAARPPPLKPITVRYIGLLERRGETFAIFTDCTAGRRTSYARAGETVDGRYRLIRIGMESVVIEHLDGTGRTTLAQNGQECVR